MRLNFVSDNLTLPNGYPLGATREPARMRETARSQCLMTVYGTNARREKSTRKYGSPRRSRSLCSFADTYKYALRTNITSEDMSVLNELSNWLITRARSFRFGAFEKDHDPHQGCAGVLKVAVYHVERLVQEPDHIVCIGQRFTAL
jgi:hypothetical protein